MKSFTSILLTAALASGVSGHAFFQELYVNDVSAGHLTGIRQPPNNNPVTDVTSSDMICNVSRTSPTDIIPVKAGDTLTTEWHHGLNGADATDGDDPIAASHKGPIITYLAKIDGATTTDVSGLKCQSSPRLMFLLSY
jgi:cellulase